MLRHSSPRQVRKYRREQNLQNRVREWAAVLQRYGDLGIEYARKHGVTVVDGFVMGDHLPSLPADYPNGLEQPK